MSVRSRKVILATDPDGQLVMLDRERSPRRCDPLILISTQEIRKRGLYVRTEEWEADSNDVVDLAINKFYSLGYGMQMTQAHLTEFRRALYDIITPGPPIKWPTFIVDFDPMNATGNVEFLDDEISMEWPDDKPADPPMQALIIAMRSSTDDDDTLIVDLSDGTFHTADLTHFVNISHPGGDQVSPGMTIEVPEYSTSPITMETVADFLLNL